MGAGALVEGGQPPNAQTEGTCLSALPHAPGGRRYRVESYSFVFNNAAQL